MFEKFLNTGTNTFQQRYNNTYGIWVDNTKKIRKLVKINNIDEGGGHLTFVDSRGIESVLYSDAKEDIGFEFVPPVRRWYPNPTHGAVLGYRVPSHQFRRGLCDDNYHVVRYNRNMTPSRMILTFNLLEQMLYDDAKGAPTLESFLKFCNSEDSPDTFYVTPQMCIHKTSATMVSVLVYDRAVATGRYLKGRSALSLTEVNQMFLNDCKKIKTHISGLTVELV